MPARQDPYRVLGVPRGATLDEIKRAYRKAALKYHPDTYDGDAAEGARIFHEKTEAYKAVMRWALLAARAERLRRQGVLSPEEMARRDTAWLNRPAPRPFRGSWVPGQPESGGPLALVIGALGINLVVACLLVAWAGGAGCCLSVFLFWATVALIASLRQDVVP